MFNIGINNKRLPIKILLIFMITFIPVIFANSILSILTPLSNEKVVINPISEVNDNSLIAQINEKIWTANGYGVTKDIYLSDRYILYSCSDTDLIYYDIKTGERNLVPFLNEGKHVLLDASNGEIKYKRDVPGADTKKLSYKFDNEGCIYFQETSSNSNVDYFLNYNIAHNMFYDFKNRDINGLKANYFGTTATLAGIDKIKAFESYEFYNAKINRMTGLDKLLRIPSFKYIGFSRCTFENPNVVLKVFGTMSGLKGLYIENDSDKKKVNTDIDFGCMNNIEELKISGLDMVYINNLQHLLNLKYLYLLYDLPVGDSEKILNTDNLKLPQNLQTLEIHIVNPLKNLNFLRGLKNLRNLNISVYKGLNNNDMDSICSLKSLENLSISTENKIDISTLLKLTNLKELNLSGNIFDDLTPLLKLSNLKTVKIDDYMCSVKGFNELKQKVKLDVNRIP